MNIAVCIKQVPDAPSIRMDRERMTIIRDGVESVINPLDYVALQAALDLRDHLSIKGIHLASIQDYRHNSVLLMCVYKFHYNLLGYLLLSCSPLFGLWIRSILETLAICKINKHNIGKT